MELPVSADLEAGYGDAGETVGGGDHGRRGVEAARRVWALTEADGNRRLGLRRASRAHPADGGESALMPPISAVLESDRHRMREVRLARALRVLEGRVAEMRRAGRPVPARWRPPSTASAPISGTHATT